MTPSVMASKCKRSESRREILKDRAAMGVWPRARGAGTAKHHLARLHHDQGHKATQRCQPVMHGIDSTA